MVATPFAFQTIQVSTVVAAHWMSPEAIARWRSFCGIFLIVTSRPFFLKMPASFASVSGAKPVQPLMPMATLVSWAAGGGGEGQGGGAEGQGEQGTHAISGKEGQPEESRRCGQVLSTLAGVAVYNRPEVIRSGGPRLTSVDPMHIRAPKCTAC